MDGGVDGHAKHDAETFDYERHGSLLANPLKRVGRTTSRQEPRS